ncbi:MAG: ADP-forming succinate--CoA ligase subunit beta [Aigarchaeota archaeon]|nr:ADP-forming succinate--CoA ligase subunit beta [Candidatus Pelearchaeum maunauluense]
MKLHEYESRELFTAYGIPVPRYGLARSGEEALKIAREIGGRVVVKAQVLVAGRGKAGGIKFAHTPEEAAEIASKMIGTAIKGEKVESVLISEYQEVEGELYLSVIIDRSRGMPLVIASPEGGVEIEELARTSPEKLIQLHVDPLIGLRPHHLRNIQNFMGLDEKYSKQLPQVLTSLYKLFVENDCELAEINPLAITSGGLVAIDAKILVDDNSLFRHSQFRRSEVGESFEVEARRMGFSYVELDGDIGIIGNGAGLTMATMDVVKEMGGRPANFLDIGGGASEEIVEKAASLLLRHPRVKVLFVNVLGGITRCDEVAKGLVSAVKAHGAGKKVVVRMMGTREEEGKKILRESGLYPYDSMEEAAQMAAQLVQG